MKPTLFALIIIIVLSLTQGCVLLKNQEQSKLIAERAAYRISQQVLKRHPEWREHFEKARAELVALQAQPKLDALAVVEILDRLPEDALGADGAWIITDAATLTIMVVGDPALKPEAEAQVRAVVAGLIAGLDRRLATP